MCPKNWLSSRKSSQKNFFGITRFFRKSKFLKKRSFHMNEIFLRDCPFKKILAALRGK